MLDSNVFHRDVYAERWILASILQRAAAGELVVVVPRVVVEELIRQFPGRLTILTIAVKEIEADLQGFEIEPPAMPPVEAAIADYRKRLESRLSGKGCRIADHPGQGAKVGEWVAQRRKPIKPDGTGAPDALVWLTTLELACANPQDDVLLISANTHDFAQGKKEATLHEALLMDLDEAQVGRNRVKLLTDAGQFLRRYPSPEAIASSEAERWLEDSGTLEALKTAISDELEWYPVEDLDPGEWGIPAPDVEGAHLNGFDPAAIEVLTAERTDDRLQMLLLTRGAARPLPLEGRCGSAASRPPSHGHRLGLEREPFVGRDGRLGGTRSRGLHRRWRHPSFRGRCKPHLIAERSLTLRPAAGSNPGDAIATSRLDGRQRDGQLRES